MKSTGLMSEGLEPHVQQLFPVRHALGHPKEVAHLQGPEHVIDLSQGQRSDWNMSIHLTHPHCGIFGKVAQIDYIIFRA